MAIDAFGRTTLAGVKISQPVYNRFGLLALYHNMTSGEVLKGLVEQWTKCGGPEDGTLIHEIAMRVYKNWVSQGGDSYCNFKLYCLDEVAVVLEKRRVSRGYIKDIIAALKRIHEDKSGEIHDKAKRKGDQ